MTIEEAIRAIKHDLRWNLLKDYQEDVAGIAILALEKQIPKKVIITTSTVRCSNCNKQLTNKGSLHSGYKFCKWCGQALDWSADELSKPKGKRMFTDEQMDRILWEIEQINKEQREKEND